jgi:hypothetical protein
MHHMHACTTCMHHHMHVALLAPGHMASQRSVPGCTPAAAALALHKSRQACPWHSLGARSKAGKRMGYVQHYKQHYKQQYKQHLRPHQI